MATRVDYNKVFQKLGTVVSDGYYDYVVSDFRMSSQVYELWCKTRQAFYLVGVNSLDAFYRKVSS